MASSRANTPQRDTVFVGNLPQTTTSEDLKSIFSEIGEIRRCVAVHNDDEAKTCKGFGFVTFSVKENVEKALRGNFEFHGRKLRVDHTKSRNDAKEEKGKFQNGNKGKKGRLIVRNVSFKADAEFLKTTFSKFGNVTEMSLPQNPDGKMRGFAFVQFDNMKSSINALNEMNGKEILGRPVAVDFAVSRDKYTSVNSSGYKPNNNIVKKEVSSEEEDDGSGIEDDDDKSVDEGSDIEDDDNKSVDDGSDIEGDDNQNADEGSDIEEDDNKKVDLGSDIEDDDESMAEESDSEEEPIDISMNSSAKLSSPVKESLKNMNHSVNEDVSDNNDSEDDDKSDTDEDDGDSDLDSTDSDEEANNKGVESSLDEDSDSGTDLEETLKKSSESKRPKERQRQLNDAADGRTLFIRNVPFGIEQEDLKETMEKFGPLNYVRLCINWETECPNGKAFARFQKKEDAEKCLTESNTEEGKIILDGRQLFVCLALTKQDLSQKLNQSEKNEEKGKDKRNLYLAREGMIRPGSEAAQGVSKGDLDKRVQRELTKRKLLQNLHNFVSSTRLLVDNLPPNLNDYQLKELFLDAVDDQCAEITEARIIRDKTDKSKGFGFVTFTQHEHALKVLRELNNSPHIFSPKRRPIVEFSIENRNIVNAKEKRLENSKKNVHSPSEGSVATFKQGNSTTRVHIPKNNEVKKDSSRTRLRATVMESNTSGNTDEALQTFSGFRAQVGIKKLPSHTGPKIRHKERNQRGKDVNRKRKSFQQVPGTWKQGGKQTSVQKVDDTKQNEVDFSFSSPEKKTKPQSNKVQRGKKRKNQMSNDHEENVFQGLVKKYKSHLLSWQGQKDRKKWFEDA